MAVDFTCWLDLGMGGPDETGLLVRVCFWMRLAFELVD